MHVKHCGIRFAPTVAATLAFALGILAPSVAYGDSTTVNERGEYSFMPEDAFVSEEMLVQEPLSAGTELGVIEIGGANRYETVAKEALHSYKTSDVVIVASGAGWADSIAAAGLAGALDCPILLTDPNAVPDVTSRAIDALKPSHIILLGSEDVSSKSVYNALASKVKKVDRVFGADRFATQMAIYDYGKSFGLWSGDTAVVVSAAGYADALSMSPVSFKLKAPVFFCNWSGNLPAAQKDALSSLGMSRYLLTGSTVVTSSSTEKWLGTLGEVKRLGGKTRYETSFEIASYAVAGLGFSWEGLAFASGQGPYDSLGGGVVQGKDNSVLLLADASGGALTARLAASNGAKGVSSVKFFGSAVVVPTKVRVEICRHLGVAAYGNVRQTSYPISLDRMTQLQVKRGEAFSYSQFYDALNPFNTTYGSSEFFQFALLNEGYSGVSAGKLNEYVSANCAYSESAYGVTSTLRGMGDVFVEAARTHGVNEVYLLSHAIWESGWGCSALSQGWTPDTNGEVIVSGVSYPYRAGVTYYNFFGIGAVDENALNGGRAMAVKEGWTSPRAAILGAAKWISSNYHNRVTARQDTLYLMKFDVGGAAKTGSAWHEYCTGLDSWSRGIARVMSNAYRFAGYSPLNAPVVFDVPAYS